MKIRCSLQRNRAMTNLDAAFVIFVIVLLLVIFLPVISRPRHYPEYSCSNNLKQLGLAYRICAGDNNDKFPMDISVTNGGTMELMSTPDAWKTYQVMSNELSTPKILYCPEDALRPDAATNWNGDLKNKISYFISLDASNAVPYMMLSGDGNFLLNGSPANQGLVNATAKDTLAWDTTRHGYPPNSHRKTATGNIGFSEGSVQSSANNQDLGKYLQQTGFATNRFFIP